MKRQYLVALAAALMLAFSGVVGIGSASAAPAKPQAGPGTTAVGAAAPVGGQARASAPRSMSLQASAAQPQRQVSPRTFGTLRRDGRQTADALPAQAGNGHKAAPTAAARPLIPASTVINANFPAINQTNSNCGGCQPPDVNAAVGLNEIVETVNLRLQVYNKTGAALCGVPLSSWFAGTLSDPRVQFDNAFNRYSMVVIPVPPAGGTPTLYLATSQTANPCGSWFLYSITFSGPLFPAGTLLDYPYLGQDRDATSPALLLSSNNFCCSPSFPTYLGSAAFWVPKSAAYAGAGFSFSVFNVAFSSAPVTVSGIPMTVTSSSYYLASVPGSGYSLYRKSGGTLVLQANISSPFTAPTRLVTQGGTLPGLDPLDGRIVWAPVQLGSNVFFAHGIDIGGFPGVRWGAVNTAANTATVALAFHSGTSDDFNPSIGVSTAGGCRVWLNWTYTDVPASHPQTSPTWNGSTSCAVVNLIGTDQTLRVGTTSSTNFRFGDYSSVAIDPVGGGVTAVVAQEYFIGGTNWSTNIARITF